MNWLKPSIEATKSRYILGIINVEYEDDICEEIHILTFNGLRNRWQDKNSFRNDIMLSDIKWYIPIPELPKE